MGLFSLFSNKRREDSLDRKITAISENISSSFQKVKDDIKSVGKWINRFEENDQKHSDDIAYLRSELQYLRTLISERPIHQEIKQERARKITHKPVIEAVVEEESFEIPSQSVIDTLTDTQRSIFSRLGVLQKEGSQPWVPLKQLAQEVYPEKKYDEVRSTISEYMGLLSDAGLVKRVRKGKQTFVSVSEKGSALFSKQPKENLVKARKKK